MFGAVQRCDSQRSCSAIIVAAVCGLPSTRAANPRSCTARSSEEPHRLVPRAGQGLGVQILLQHVVGIRHSVSMISFHQLIDGGDKDGARAKFERLVAQLVSRQYQGVKIVAALRGDWGLDVVVGEIDAVLSVWQAKFFIDGVGEAQKAQIRESFKAVMEKAGQKGFTVNVWTLCIPIDLDPDALTWWTGWKKRKEREHGVRIELWHRTALETVLLSPDAERILVAYFPNVATPGASPPAVQELPEDVMYEDMLFIKQLQAARIAELESAKQQFFNAEALAREVADKRVPDHMNALRAERADLRSIWEDRYNKACTDCDDAEGLLPPLHPEVMAAIERRHDSGRLEVLPMHLIHRKGGMHQVVESGDAGWVRDFRAVTEAHRA
jgi:hypothetical protein